MKFKFQRLEIPEVILCTPLVLEDERGWFFEAYHQREFTQGGIPDAFVQDNVSYSVAGTLRGIHYQVPPMAQAKLVRCVSGSILDVAVDLRKNSPTFGKWVARELSDQNRENLYVPEGFGHAFQVLGDGAEISYKISTLYSPEFEFGVHWNDEQLSIDWPLRDTMVVSSKDSNLPRLKEQTIFP
jgi:dTDP-4-dehydrorhamnose 3,5-epimerase